MWDKERMIRRAVYLLSASGLWFVENRFWHSVVFGRGECVKLAVPQVNGRENPSCNIAVAIEYPPNASESIGRAVAVSFLELLNWAWRIFGWLRHSCLGKVASSKVSIHTCCSHRNCMAFNKYIAQTCSSVPAGVSPCYSFASVSSDSFARLRFNGNVLNMIWCNQSWYVRTSIDPYIPHKHTYVQ